MNHIFILEEFQKPLTILCKYGKIELYREIPILHKFSFLFIPKDFGFTYIIKNNQSGRKENGKGN